MDEESVEFKVEVEEKSVEVETSNKPDNNNWKQSSSHGCIEKLPQKKEDIVRFKKPDIVCYKEPMSGKNDCI